MQRIEAIELGSTKQSLDRGSASAGALRASKQPVLFADCDWTYRIFDGVVMTQRSCSTQAAKLNASNGGFNSRRLMWKLVVAGHDLAADDAAGPLQTLEAIAVEAYVIQRSRHRTTWKTSLLNGCSGQQGESAT